MSFEIGILSRLRKIRPGTLLIGGFVLGATMVLISVLIGIGFAPEGRRHTGYAQAFNWSVTFTVAFPLLGYFATRFFRGVDRRLERLSVMFVDDQGNALPDGASKATSIFRARTKAMSPVVDLLAVVCLVASLGEWYAESVGPLLGQFETREVDWAVALNGQGVASEVANGLFALLAFVMQATWAAFLLAYLALAIAFEQTIDELTDRRKPPFLVPDVGSDDPRLGFERVGALVDDLLFAFGAIFIVLWLTRLQNLFLRSTAESSIGMFLEGVGEIGTDASRMIPWILDTRFDIRDYSSLIVVLAAIVMVAVSVMLPLIALRRCAMSAREKAYDLHRDGWAPEGIDPSEVRERLGGMQFWPLRYPTVNATIGLSFLCILSLVAFRLGTLMFVWVLGAVLERVLRELLGSSSEEGGET